MTYLVPAAEVALLRTQLVFAGYSGSLFVLFTYNAGKTARTSNTLVILLNYWV